MPAEFPAGSDNLSVLGDPCVFPHLHPGMPAAPWHRGIGHLPSRSRLFCLTGQVHQAHFPLESNTMAALLGITGPIPFTCKRSALATSGFMCRSSGAAIVSFFRRGMLSNIELVDPNSLHWSHCAVSLQGFTLSGTCGLISQTARWRSMRSRRCLSGWSSPGFLSFGPSPTQAGPSVSRGSCRLQPVDD